jgi:hypothetical protein
MKDDFAPWWPDDREAPTAPGSGQLGGIAWFTVFALGGLFWLAVLWLLGF